MAAEYPTTHQPDFEMIPEPQRVGPGKNIVNTLTTYAELTAVLSAVVLFSAHVAKRGKGKETRKPKQTTTPAASSLRAGNGLSNEQILQRAKANQIARGRNKAEARRPGGIGHTDRALGRNAKTKRRRS